MSVSPLVSSDLRIGGRLDARFFALLEAVAATGSISRAARTVGLSYKGAWLLLENASNLANAPLFESTTGGHRGGGTRLTGEALQLLDCWHVLTHEHREFMRRQEQRLACHPAFAGLLRRMSMRTTARNQFFGTISAIAHGTVTSEVTVTLRSGEQIVAAMTYASAKRLKLKTGKEALAIIKASEVVLVSDLSGWQLSSRNQLSGTVSRIVPGGVSSLVVLTLPGGTTVTSSVTNEGVEALGLVIGSSATAVFKAYSVMVAAQP